MGAYICRYLIGSVACVCMCVCVLCARMRGRGDAFAGHRKSGVGFAATPSRRRRRDQSMLGQHAVSQDAHDRVSGRRKLDGSLQCVSVGAYTCMCVHRYTHTVGHRYVSVYVGICAGVMCVYVEGVMCVMYNRVCLVF